MFDIFPKLLSSIASFLFPLFASYKALQTSDPAQLTPWLMYWVVLACFLVVESWTDWFLVWIPFYAYLRLLFHLYLVLPQTQGARIIYQTHLQPYLHDNEQAIEDFIASAHHRLKQAGINYIKRAIELLRTNVFGLPPSPAATAGSASTGYGQGGQGYTQSLLARFSLPGARWGGATGAAGQGDTAAGGAADFYSMLASAVGAATGGGAAARAEDRGADHGFGGLAAGLVPDNIQGANAKMSFIAAQRERLALLMSALDREASQLQTETEDRARTGSSTAGTEAAPLTKSRSEADFEKLEAESGEEEEGEGGVELRRRTPGLGGQAAGWVSWAWGGGGGGAGAKTAASAGSATTSGSDAGAGDEGHSTGVEK